MSCCRKSKPAPMAARRPVPVPRAAVDANTGNPTPSPLCGTLEANGLNTTISYVRGSLVLIHDGTKFELFSTITSQGCATPWAEDLRQKWFKLTPARREQAVKRLTKTEFSIQELMTVLA